MSSGSDDDEQNFASEVMEIEEAYAQMYKAFKKQGDKEAASDLKRNVGNWIRLYKLIEEEEPSIDDVVKHWRKMQESSWRSLKTLLSTLQDSSDSSSAEESDSSEESSSHSESERAVEGAVKVASATTENGTKRKRADSSSSSSDGESSDSSSSSSSSSSHAGFPGIVEQAIVNGTEATLSASEDGSEADSDSESESSSSSSSSSASSSDSESDSKSAASSESDSSEEEAKPAHSNGKLHGTKLKSEKSKATVPQPTEVPKTTKKRRTDVDGSAVPTATTSATVKEVKEKPKPKPNGHEKPKTKSNGVRASEEPVSATVTNGDAGKEPPRKKEPRMSNTPFQRIKPDAVSFQDDRLKDNSFAARGGKMGDYGERASSDLIVTRGAGFRKEKNKKKRGSYRGGEITMESHSIKF